MLGGFTSNSIIIFIPVDGELDPGTHGVISSTGDVVVVVGGLLNISNGIVNLVKNKPCLGLNMSTWSILDLFDKGEYIDMESSYPPPLLAL